MYANDQPHGLAISPPGKAPVPSEYKAGWDLHPEGTGMQTMNQPAHSLFTAHTRLSQPQLYLKNIDHEARLSSCNCLLLRSRYSPQHPQSLSFHYCEAHINQVTAQFCVFRSPYIQTANRKLNDLNWIVETICQILATSINFPCMHFYLSLTNIWTMPQFFKIYLH